MLEFEGTFAVTKLVSVEAFVIVLSGPLDILEYPKRGLQRRAHRVSCYRCVPFSTPNLFARSSDSSDFVATISL